MKPQLLVLALALAAGAVSAGEGFDLFIPSWQPGMEWKVKSQYRVHEGGVPGPISRERTWSEPIVWKYRVMGRQRDRNIEIIRLRAEQIAGPGKGIAGFFFIAELTPSKAIKTLSLARVAYRSEGRGGEPDSVDYTRKATAPYPVINELSLAPADFPMFEMPERVSSRQRTTHYEITEPHAGMFFSRDVVQTIERASLPANDSRLLVPLPKGQAILEVTVLRPGDRAGFRQLWAAGQPWALFSENGTQRSWLVP